MKKRVYGKYFSRDRGSRKALFRSLIRSLVLSGKINTTKSKAKAIQSDIEKLVRLSKKTDVSARRKVFSTLANDRTITEILFTSVAKAFENVETGFTRTINLPSRKGDAAKMARLEWTKEVVLVNKKDEKAKKAETKVEKKEKKPLEKKAVKTVKKAKTTKEVKK